MAKPLEVFSLRGRRDHSAASAERGSNCKAPALQLTQSPQHWRRQKDNERHLKILKNSNSESSLVMALIAWWDMWKMMWKLMYFRTQNNLKPPSCSYAGLLGGALRISRRWPLPRTSRNPQNPDAQNVAGDRVHTGNILTLVILWTNHFDILHILPHLPGEGL